MPPCIIITGTPCVGKSTLAIKLTQRLNWVRLDLHQHYKEIAQTYNKEKQCYDIDLKKFQKLVLDEKKKTTQGLIIDSHIAHLLPKRIVDYCIVLTCSNLKTLHARLAKRNYPKRKIEENIEAEIMQVCLLEAQEKNHHILTFDTAKKTTNEIAQEINSLLKHNKLT